MQIEKIDFYGMSAIHFEAGGYEAIMIPEIGANVVKLSHKASGTNILRTPAEDEIETFKGRPQVFGLPLLFPSNRIEDGTYSFENRTYKYPITIPAQNNYHHGIIKSQPFIITRTETGNDYVEIEASYFSNLFNDPIYKHFPHEFICRMIFRLSAEGLKQTTVFINQSKENMPIGMGFHTPINVPFTTNGKRNNYKLKLSVGKRWEMSERSLPIGKLNDLNEEEALLRTEGLYPFGKAIEWALTNEPLSIDGKNYNGAILTDTEKGISVFYETDEQFKHWTLWNNGGEVPYVCPEPQSWATNAPNLKLPAQLTGFQFIEPGKEWKAVTRLYVK